MTVNDLIHRKRTGHCLRVLEEEERLYPGSGLLAEVRELCKKYKVEDVTSRYVSKDIIRQKVWDFGRKEIWKEAIKNKRIPYSHNHLNKGNILNYMQLPKYEARMYFTYMIGELQFKNNRKGEFIKRFGDLKCFQKNCENLDSLEHVMTCQYYDNRYTETGHDRDLE